MKKLFKSLSINSDLKLDQFRTRLVARLFIVLIFFAQAAERIYFTYSRNGVFNSTSPSNLSFPFLFALIFIILLEGFLYKKLGSRVLRYSQLVDVIFFIFFTIEWLVSWVVAIERLKYSGHSLLSFSALIAFSSMAWRTLIQSFIVKHWFLRIVAPVCAHGLLISFALQKCPDDMTFILTKGISQIIYIISIFYLESKMNLRLLLANVEQEKWMQINKFILDNIPENIAIFNMEGELTYTNEYFNQFLNQCTCTQDIKLLLKEIKDLQKQNESESINIDTLEKICITKRRSSESLRQDTERREEIFEISDTLEDLIKRFQTRATYNKIGEKSFMIYNGKMKLTDQAEKSIEVKISFVTHSSKRYIVLIIRDTTHRDLFLNLESNNKYKDRLLASVSHELRTPLNGNINFIEAAVKSREVPQEIKQSFLEPALKSSKFLLHLINDILDMSQITAQKLRLTFRSFNLKETLLSSLQLVELQAQKKGIRVQVDLDPHLPTIFCTDHMRLSQIVLNLLNNSIKFTQEGYVKLAATVVQGTSLVRVSVEDSGIGIEKENIQGLFREFSRVDIENRSLINPNGVGLGLSISYKLAELLGPEGNDSITVVSVPNRGSTFSFVIESKDTGLHLPMNTEEWSQTTDNINIDIEPVLDSRLLSQFSTKLMKKPSEFGLKVTPTNSCECPKILIVDDNTFNIMAFESILTLFNVKSDCTYNGKKAIEKVIKRVQSPCGENCRPYDIIFMDQEMPGMNGVETTKEIMTLKHTHLLSEMKMIGCTAHAEQNEQVDHFLQSGIDECIFKPISPKIIQEILERYKITENVL